MGKSLVVFAAIAAPDGRAAGGRPGCPTRNIHWLPRTDRTLRRTWLARVWKPRSAVGFAASALAIAVVETGAAQEDVDRLLEAPVEQVARSPREGRDRACRRAVPSFWGRWKRWIAYRKKRARTRSYRLSLRRRNWSRAAHSATNCSKVAARQKASSERSRTAADCAMIIWTSSLMGVDHLPVCLMVDEGTLAPLYHQGLRFTCRCEEAQRLGH
jgi:hypothetical protein